jgi:integrase
MARYTTGPRVWTDPASGIHYVRFEYQRQQIFESTGTRNLGEAQAKANAVFAEVVSGRRISNGQALAAAPSREILVLAAAWLAEVEAELSESTRENYETYAATHLAPFFKTIDRVTSESAIDYRRMRLKAVQRISLLKELSCLRGFMKWCKSKNYIVEVPVIESPSEKVTGTVDTTKRHKAEPVPLDQSEAYAIIENLPEFAERARPDRPRFRVRDVVALWWETALRPVTIGRLRCPDHFRPGATDLTITRDIDKVRYKRQLPLTELALQALERSCPDIGLIFGVHDLRPQLLKAARRAHEGGKLPGWKIERVSPYDFRHGRTTQLANQTKHLAGVSFLVGHKDPSTTAKYVHAVREHAEEALRAVSSGLADQKTADEVPPQATLPVAVGQELLMDTCGPPSPGDQADRAKSAVRKGGLEPPRELPHWNLNCGVGDVSIGKVEGSVRQETSGNAKQRQLSGRSDPNLRETIARLLGTAHSRWRAEVSVPRLRCALLEILQKLERG